MSSISRGPLYIWARIVLLLFGHDYNTWNTRKSSFTRIRPKPVTPVSFPITPVSVYCSPSCRCRCLRVLVFLQASLILLTATFACQQNSLGRQRHLVMSIDSKQGHQRGRTRRRRARRPSRRAASCCARRRRRQAVHRRGEQA